MSRTSESSGRGAEPGSGSDAPRGLFGAFDDPVATLRRMSEQMEKVFHEVTGGRLRGAAREPAAAGGEWMPRAEVFQRGDELVISIDLPGVRREDVQADIGDGAIVVRGERRQALERAEGGVLRSECSYGRFYRAVPLPEGASADAARAAMRDGVLEITLPMPPRRQPRRLDIQDEAVGARKEAPRYQSAEPANEPQPHGEQDRRQGERRDWQSEGRLGM
jgi:HSP20 family protein